MGAGTTSTLEERIDLTEIPLDLPISPFWEEFRSFGTDESIAAVLNVAGTWVIDNVLQDAVMDEWMRTGLIAVAGPGVEKLGFFPQHLYNAWRTYKKTPEESRKPLRDYLKQGGKEGFASLLKDLIVHDPLYIGGMVAGQTLFPEVPAAAVAAASFVGAIAIVAGVSVGIEEIKYSHHKKKLTDSGFLVEPSYYEGRFLIEPRYNPLSVMQEVAEQFGLSNMRTRHYHDKYFAHTINSYNNRIPKLRLRKRETEGGYVETAQIIHTRTKKLANRKISSYNCYPCSKEKVYFPLDQSVMPWHFEDIEHEGVRTTLLEVADEEAPSIEIEFDRTLANDPQAMLIAADNVSQYQGEPFHAIEIKSRTKSILKQAMETIMRYSVDQTTATKLDLAKLYQVYSPQPVR